MSIKVYIHYEPAGGPEKTSKLSVPKKWVAERAVADVIGLFTEAYNASHPEHALNTAECHLATNDGEKIYSNSIIGSVLQDRYDYYVKRGVYVEAKAESGAGEAVPGVTRLLCKNYGCGKYFVDSENGPEACRHHVLPPLFHDCVKGWSCCKDRKAYDWDEFQKIEGCAAGPHSTVDPKLMFAMSPNAPKEGAAATAADAAPAPVLKSIADYNTSNPDAANAATSAAKTILTRKSTRKPDGTARCLNKGCQMEFNVSENNAEACVYHQGQPIFHDAAKFWSCCPGRRCYDFDEFMKVVGCKRGFHDDGEIDIAALNP